MLNLKITDRCLIFSFYLFLTLALFSLTVEIKDYLLEIDGKIKLKPFFTFLFLAFFAKYNYAIQNWLKKLYAINNEEKSR